VPSLARPNHVAATVSHGTLKTERHSETNFVGSTASNATAVALVRKAPIWAAYGARMSGVVRPDDWGEPWDHGSWRGHGTPMTTLVTHTVADASPSATVTPVTDWGSSETT